LTTDSEQTAIKIIKIGLLAVLIMTLTDSFSSVARAEREYNCVAGDHKYIVTMIEPAAGTDGKKTFVCELCGYRYTQILPATDHLWGEWIIDRQPDCTRPGERHRTCTATDIPHREYGDIPALGHNYGVNITNPDCEHNGRKIYTCKQCGDSYAEAFGQADGHSYKEEITVPPEYNKEGLKTFTCEYCGDSYTESIPKITEHEHQYSAYSEAEPDCERDGYRTYVCTVCGDKYSDAAPATSHNYGEWVTTKVPTLFGEGNRRRICGNNPEHIITESIPRLVTMETNTADAVMAPTNLGLLLAFIFFILSDLYVIFWDLRMRRKRKQAQWLKMQYALIAVALTAAITGLSLILLIFFPGITYLNLMGLTAIALIIPTGTVLRTRVYRRVSDLNGNGGVYVPGTQKGLMVSRNRII
jgi:rubredoxin